MNIKQQVRALAVEAKKSGSLRIIGSDGHIYGIAYPESIEGRRSSSYGKFVINSILRNNEGMYTGRIVCGLSRAHIRRMLSDLRDARVIGLA